MRNVTINNEFCIVSFLVFVLVYSLAFLWKRLILIRIYLQRFIHVIQTFHIRCLYYFPTETWFIVTFCLFYFLLFFFFFLSLKVIEFRSSCVFSREIFFRKWLQSKSKGYNASKIVKIKTNKHPIKTFLVFWRITKISFALLYNCSKPTRQTTTRIFSIKTCMIQMVLSLFELEIIITW